MTVLVDESNFQQEVVHQDTKRALGKPLKMGMAVWFLICVSGCQQVVSVVWDDEPKRQGSPSNPDAGLSVDNRPELGAVKWQRGLDKIQSMSKTQNRPILLLFQEVPG